MIDTSIIVVMVLVLPVSLAVWSVLNFFFGDDD